MKFISILDSEADIDNLKSVKKIKKISKKTPFNILDIKTPKISPKEIKYQNYINHDILPKKLSSPEASPTDVLIIPQSKKTKNISQKNKNFNIDLSKNEDINRDDTSTPNININKSISKNFDNINENNKNINLKNIKFSSVSKNYVNKRKNTQKPSKNIQNFQKIKGTSFQEIIKNEKNEKFKDVQNLKFDYNKPKKSLKIDKMPKISNNILKSNKINMNIDLNTSKNEIIGSKLKIKNELSSKSAENHQKMHTMKSFENFSDSKNSKNKSAKDLFNVSSSNLYRHTNTQIKNDTSSEFSNFQNSKIQNLNENQEKKSVKKLNKTKKILIVINLLLTSLENSTYKTEYQIFGDENRKIIISNMINNIVEEEYNIMLNNITRIVEHKTK